MKYGWRRPSDNRYIEGEDCMPIGIRIKLSGVTEDVFDKAHDEINPDRTPPKGLVFHASGPIDGGWGIIDFWESRADYDEFSKRIEAGMKAAGVELQGPPDVKEFPVHETIQS
jgi:hypothetical protein